jgi:adenylate cyclase
VRKSAAGFLIGAGGAALVLALDLLFALAPGGPNPLRTIESKSYDWRLARTARPESARRDIALVEINEYSLRNLEPYVGKWPWPRAVHAELVRYLSRAPATVIGYDVNFAGADAKRTFQFGGATVSGEQSDQELADAVRAAGNVVLLADATYEGIAAGSGEGDTPDTGFRLGTAIRERRRIFLPYPAVAATAAGFGHNLFSLDPDGVIRHIAPFVRSGDRALPSLGVAAALRALAIEPRDVRLAGSALQFGTRAMPLSEERVRTSDGVESYVWSLIRFRGPAQLPDLNGTTYPTYAFFDLLASEEQIRAGETPKIDPALFRDKIVFVGATAAGLYDAFETPFANGRSPGIYVHAAVADDLRSNRFMTPESSGVTIALVIGLAVGIGLIGTALPAGWATCITLLIFVAFAAIATEALARGFWLNVTQPVLAGSLALFGAVGYQYFVEGREKRRVKQLFGRYVSRDVFERLIANPDLARLGGERREMTVLFSDIRGFTSLSEQGQPEDIVRMLNEYFTRMVEILFRHKGTVDKFVGDMVMALFGAPLDDRDHAEHAVDAALEMVEALVRLNERWAAEGRPALDIGIGISTGPMIAGNVGSDAIMSYTVIGDVVNLGARLESLNKQYGTRIIVSEATRTALPDRYVFRPLGDVLVKGKARPVAIFELTGRVSDAAPSPAAKEAQL